MTFKPSTLYSAKVIKRASGVALVALQTYRGVLAAKLFTTDTLINIIKSRKKSKLVLPHSLPVLNKEIITVKEEKSMKKSNFGGVLIFLTAVCAAIGAAAYYIHKKEKELSDYEDMLFDEEYLDGYMPEEGEDCGCCDCEETTQDKTCEMPKKAEQNKKPEEPTFD